MTQTVIVELNDGSSATPTVRASSVSTRAGTTGAGFGTRRIGRLIATDEDTAANFVWLFLGNLTGLSRLLVYVAARSASERSQRSRVASQRDPQKR